MDVFQSHFQNGSWFPELPNESHAQWVIMFGDRNIAADPDFLKIINGVFSKAELMGCSTSGEICDLQVYDNTMVLTAVTFDNTDIVTASVSAKNYSSSFEVGKALVEKLSTDNLKYVFVLSDGQMVNGTELVNGLTESLPEDVLISGGLAGDDARFEETIVWHNKQQASGLVAVCGFYGNHIKFGHGTLGGWDAFGPEREVTHSKGNILYELDGKPALALYKTYLGEYSKDLPSSALLFPLCLQAPDEKESVVRTILNINETDQSMVFAGDIPQGYTAKLMKANFERLIDGASGAAEHAKEALKQDAKLALLISCVGRRLVLNQRVEEELESVSEVLGENCVKSGFYSYGELSPLVNSNSCYLHNQTMTITTLSED